MKLHPWLVAPALLAGCGLVNSNTLQHPITPSIRRKRSWRASATRRRARCRWWRAIRRRRPTPCSSLQAMLPAQLDGATCRATRPRACAPPSSTCGWPTRSTCRCRACRREVVQYGVDHVSDRHDRLLDHEEPASTWTSRRSTSTWRRRRPRTRTTPAPSSSAPSPSCRRARSAPIRPTATGDSGHAGRAAGVRRAAHRRGTVGARRRSSRTTRRRSSSSRTPRWWRTAAIRCRRATSTSSCGRRSVLGPQVGRRRAVL